jgi:hypothetical protein
MQKPDWHCIGALKPQRPDRRPHLHRPRPHLVHPDEGFHRLHLRRSARDRRQPRQRQPGRHGLAGRRRHHRARRLHPRLRRRVRHEGNWDGYTDEEMLRPGHDVQNILIEHSELSTSISTSCAPAGRERPSTRATSPCATPTFCTAASAPAARPSACSASGARTAQRATTPTTPLRICSSTTGTRWCRWSRSSRPARLHLPQHLGARPAAAGRFHPHRRRLRRDLRQREVRPDRAASDADLPLVVSGGAQPPIFTPRMGPVAAVHRRSAGLCARAEGHLHRASLAGARYTWLFGDGTQATGRSVATLSRRRRNRAGRRSQRRGPLSRSAPRRRQGRENRTGPRREWWPWPMARCASIAVPTVPGLAWQIYPGELDRAARPDQRARGLQRRVAQPARRCAGIHALRRRWDGFIDIPADGGYTFHLLDRDGARLVIDGVEVAKTGPPFAQVCGSPGNAMRYDRGSLGLRAGKHTFIWKGCTPPARARRACCGKARSAADRRASSRGGVTATRGWLFSS